MDTLSQLKGVSIVVADTADFTQIAQYQPRDATTNPAIIEAATRNPQFEGLVRDALQYACARGGTLEEQLDAAMTKLPVNFGCELLKRVPGRISTEVDARLSFDLAGSLAKGREIAAMYRAAGIGPERVLIKLAATWEGIQAAKQLEAEGIHCNCTLLFGFAQAVACAQAGVTLISPFVARVTDWFAGGRDRPGKLSPDITTAAQEPGVARVARVVRYFRRHGYPTTVMPASLRTPEEVLALAGCDYFTIAPALLERLQNMDVPVERVLQPPTHAGDDCGCDEAKLPPMTEPAFRFALNEDCCATQSLADGIRQFSQASRDLEARLRPLLQEQLSGEKR